MSAANLPPPPLEDPVESNSNSSFVSPAFNKNNLRGNSSPEFYSSLSSPPPFANHSSPNLFNSSPPPTLSSSSPTPKLSSSMPSSQSFFLPPPSSSSLPSHASFLPPPPSHSTSSLNLIIPPRNRLLSALQKNLDLADEQQNLLNQISSLLFSK